MEWTEIEHDFRACNNIYIHIYIYTNIYRILLIYINDDRKHETIQRESVHQNPKQVRKTKWTSPNKLQVPVQGSSLIEV
jgi:hypothetical protein